MTEPIDEAEREEIFKAAKPAKPKADRRGFNRVVAQVPAAKVVPRPALPAPPLPELPLVLAPPTALPVPPLIELAEIYTALRVCFDTQMGIMHRLDKLVRSLHRDRPHT